jgi:hypothetical protein
LCPARRVSFQTSEFPPYISTVLIEPDGLKVSSGPCSSKKQAEWQAADEMLRNAGLSTAQQSSPASVVNYKGMLQEQLTKIPNPPKDYYDTTNSAPFVCTLTLKGGAAAATEPLSVISEGQPTKKAAKQQAAERMLQHPFIARGTDLNRAPISLSPAAPALARDLVVSSNITPLSAEPEGVTQATLPDSAVVDLPPVGLDSPSPSTPETITGSAVDTISAVDEVTTAETPLITEPTNRSIDHHSCVVTSSGSINSYSVAVVANSNSNHKGLLLEKVAKYVPEYEAVFVFESSLAALFLSTVTVRRKDGQVGGGELALPGQEAPTKKQAEQNASFAMLNSAEFQTFCDTARAARLQSPLTDAARLQSSPAPVVNYKGMLQEQLTKIPNPPKDYYDTTNSAPFVCTLTLKGGAAAATEPLSVISEGQPTKKAAKQQAAERMLQHPFIARGTDLNRAPMSLSPAAPALARDLVVSSNITPLSAAPEGVTQATLPDSAVVDLPPVGLEPISPPDHSPSPLTTAALISIPEYVDLFAAPTPATPVRVAAVDALSPACVSTPSHFAVATAPRGEAAAMIPGASSLPTTSVANGKNEGSPALGGLSRSLSFSSQQSSCGSATPVVNYKGMLHEQRTEMLDPPQDSSYQTTHSAPFVCTLTPTLQGGAAAATEPLSVISEGQPTKKAAEQQAVEGMLQHPFIARDADCSAECLSDQTVSCRKCREQIGTIADFMFYDKTNAQVQLALKPETAFLLAAAGVEDGQKEMEKALPCISIGPSEADPPAELVLKGKNKVICSHCEYSLGVQMATGPDSASLISFGNNKVVLKGRSFEMSQAWRTVSEAPAFGDIEHRTERTFFGDLNAQTPNTTRRSLNYLPVNFPKLHNDSVLESEDFRISDLLSKHCKKEMKPEQLQAFHMALQWNMAVVFPTGFGKTFVASLVMHRFRLLNPKKLAVMVVDRIPLVEQQSTAIHRDTGLLVCPLSSANSTRYIIEALLSGKYDALVVTAGALHNYLHEGALQVSDFSAFIFDECHHVVGEHMYTRILDLIGQCRQRLQPRVVGLTASPFSAKSSTSAEVKLQDMLAALHGAKIYCPKILNVSTQEIVRHPVILTAEQS